jgi:hypothetical protein
MKGVREEEGLEVVVVGAVVRAEVVWGKVGVGLSKGGQEEREVDLGEGVKEGA